MSFRTNEKNNLIQGFTLIEIVLVMFLVSFVFIGIYSILAKTAQHEKDNRYVIIASNLAQEGVEIIRNKRDENLLEELDMNENLSGGTCQPYWDGTTAYCDNTKSPKIGLDGNGIYRNDDSLPLTIFERSCEISTVNPPGDPAEVLLAECTVVWESPSLGISKEVSVESLLTNWQENIN